MRKKVNSLKNSIPYEYKNWTIGYNDGSYQYFKEKEELGSSKSGYLDIEISAEDMRLIENISSETKCGYKSFAIDENSNNGEVVTIQINRKLKDYIDNGKVYLRKSFNRNKDKYYFLILPLEFDSKLYEILETEKKWLLVK